MKIISMTIDSFIKRVRAVEGFNVEVMDQKVLAGGNKLVTVKLSTRRSPNSWTSSKWIKERISQESLSKFAVSVRWGNSKRKPHSVTDLKTIRESYPAAFGSDAKNAAQVKNWTVPSSPVAFMLPCARYQVAGHGGGICA